MFTAQDTKRVMRPDLAPEGTRTVNMMRLAEHLMDPDFDPPINVLYVYNCNLAASMPAQQNL